MTKKSKFYYVQPLLKIKAGTIFLATLITLLSIPYCHASSKNDSFQQLVNKEADKFNISGLSLSILLPTNSSSITFTAGTKSMANKTPLDKNSLFQVGSITKTFTALLLAREINHKRITFHNKIGEFLPEYPKWKNITIEQLVNNTSGIFDYIRVPGWWENLSKNQEKTWEAHELVDIAYSYPNDFPPGSAWRYSNTNYIILGMILKKITNEPVANSMKNLFEEAQLHHTYYLISPYPQAIMKQMAHGYYQYQGNRYDMTALNGSWIQSSGAIVSTTNDIARWGHTFYTNQIPFHLQNTTTGKNINSFNEIGYSFGSFRMNTPEGLIWFTPGLTSGYVSMLAYAPCLDVYFAYSANLAPLDNFHKEMILGVLHELNKDQQYIRFLREHVVLPDYCSKLKPSNKFNFPKF